MSTGFYLLPLKIRRADVRRIFCTVLGFILFGAPVFG